MRVVKSVITGVVTAIVALVVWVVASIVVALIGFQSVSETGAGGLGAVSGPISETGGLVAMTVGFAGGFYWMWKRTSRSITPS